MGVTFGGETREYRLDKQVAFELRIPIRELGDGPRLVGLGLLGNVAYQALFIYGINGTRAGNAALMLSTVPLIVTVLSVGLNHETISRAGWAGVALSIAGIVLILASRPLGQWLTAGLAGG